MHAGATIFIVLGLTAGLVGDWMILVRAYRYSTGWFLGCLLMPLAGWVFASFAMTRPAIPLSLSAGGTLLALSGWWIVRMGT